MSICLSNPLITIARTARVTPAISCAGVNAGAFLVHSALYGARPDVKCVVHVVTPSVLSVSALKAGLLPLCQEAAVLGEVRPDTL